MEMTDAGQLITLPIAAYQAAKAIGSLCRARASVGLTAIRSSQVADCGMYISSVFDILVSGVVLLKGRHDIHTFGVVNVENDTEAVHSGATASRSIDV